ncbi:MAG: restriction endonuclease subunit S [Fimbriimonadales bacterium]|nr:restriction endonuclease subunit S [Fimbriimonadales bacterium]
MTDTRHFARTTPLAEVAVLTTGYSFRSQDWQPHGVPVVRIGNVTPGRLDLSDSTFVTSDVAGSLPKFQLKAGDIVIGMTGDVGAVAWVYPSDPSAMLNQRVGKLSPKSASSVDARYLYYAISLPETRHYWQGIANGSVQRNLASSHILRTEIPLPSLTEQQRIANILGSLDDKIELNRRMNKTLEEMARAIFKAWFVDFLPVRAKMDGAKSFPGMDAETFALFPDSFQDSELGEIPSGWNVSTLGQVARNYRKQVQPTEALSESAYIGLEHMPRKSIALSDWGTLAGVVSQKFEFVAGDLLFGKLRPYFHKVGISAIGGACSTDILVIRPAAEEWLSYVLLMISSDELIAHASMAATGTRMPRADWKTIEAYDVPLPPDELAAAYERIAKPMIALICRNVSESRSLAETRDLLVPRLLRGAC